MDNEKLRYPIGKFDYEKNDWQLEELLQAVVNIQALPNELAKLFKEMKAEDLQKTYRDGSWTVQQIIHHLADSHMNAFIRMKLALTETNPQIKPYDENAWAEGKDYQFNYEASYVILVGLHQRWSLMLLEVMKTPELLLRTVFHPQWQKSFTLAQLIAQYGWHSMQHLAHLKLALGIK